MDEDDGAEESPGAALAVDVQHAEDLEEADAADGARGENLSDRQLGERRHSWSLWDLKLIESNDPPIHTTDLPVGAHRQHHDRRRHHY